MNRTLLIVAAVLVGLPLLSCGGCLGLALLLPAPDPAKLDTLPAASSVASAEPIPAKRLTLENFNRVSTGMTLEQVRALLGPPESQLSESEISGQTAAVYQWKAGYLANATATFSNGQLIAKAQFGLE